MPPTKSVFRFPLILAALAVCAGSASVWSQEVPAKGKEKAKITPGLVIVPTGAGEMRRIWGELVRLDFAKRTGTFRNESDDAVMEFSVMPYAELLHHASQGDLQDFRVGERAIFRLHENERGQWFWLTYIQDEMNMLKNHDEYFFVEKIDSERRAMECTWAKSDKSFIRATEVPIETDAETRFWKGGTAASFGDLRVGDRVRTKTHGAGSGKRRIAWEVFLDDESLIKFQSEQAALHAARMAKQGLPGYVDSVEGVGVRGTLFQEGYEFTKSLKPGQKVSVVPAGADRNPIGPPVEAVVAEAAVRGRLCQVTLTLAAPGAKFDKGGLLRLFPARAETGGGQ